MVKIPKNILFCFESKFRVNISRAIVNKYSLLIIVPGVGIIHNYFFE